MRVLGHAPVLRPAGAALAVIAAIVAFPGRSAAECGDYVHIVKDRVAAESSRLDDIFGQSEQKPPRSPCHGPNCSGNPSAPVPPITAPVSDAGSKELAARATSDANRADGREWVIAPGLRGSPTRLPSLIFHPPRAV